MNFDAVIRQMEQKRDELTNAIAALKRVAAGDVATVSAEPSKKTRKKRPMSDEQRAAIAEVQRKRWAKFHAEKDAVATANGDVAQEAVQ